MTGHESLAARLVRVSLQTKILAVVLLCVSVPVLLMGRYLIQRNEEVLGEKVRGTLQNQLFRTAGEETILDGRVPQAILTRFAYDRDYCRALTLKDRSSIYGGFHLYVMRG